MSSIRLMTGLFFFIAAITMATGAMAAGSDPLSGYRLSGTINKSNASWLALVEDSSGEQYLVRVGDQLADANVIDIGDNTIRLAIGERGWILNLEGLVETGPLVVSKLPVGRKPTATIRAEIAALAARTNIQNQSAPAAGIAGGDLPESASQSAASGGDSSGNVGGGGLMGASPGNVSGTGTSQTSSRRTNTDSAAATAPEAADGASNNNGTFEPASDDPDTAPPSIETELQRILNLPPDASIVSIDHQPVIVTEHTLDLLNQSLVTGQDSASPVRIGIKTADGDSAVYLLPENDAGNTT